MSKAIIWFLVGLGFLFFLFGLVGEEVAVLIIGLLLIAGGFYLGLRPGGLLRKEEVLDTWGILIEKGKGKAGQVLEDTEVFIKESKAPSIDMETRELAPGIVRGILGVKRKFLVVTDERNFRLEAYQIFVNARDYGDNLDVSWYLTFRPSLWQAFLSLIPYVNVVPRTLSDLDLFDQQDLRAYTTNAHHCLLKAVEKLMVDLHQDPSKIERKSRGFLGIS